MLLWAGKSSSLPCSGSQRRHGHCGCASTGAAPGPGSCRCSGLEGTTGVAHSFVSLPFPSSAGPSRPGGFSVSPARPRSPVRTLVLPAGCRGYRAAAGPSSARPQRRRAGRCRGALGPPGGRVRGSHPGAEHPGSAAHRARGRTSGLASPGSRRELRPASCGFGCGFMLRDMGLGLFQPVSFRWQLGKL